MKIAYIVTHDITTNDGITKKFQGQISEWIRKGHEVVVFCTTPNLGDSILTNVKQYQHLGAIKTRLKFNSQMYRDIQIFRPDIVYFRYDSWSITTNKILKNFNVIAELNAYELGELKLLIKHEKSIKSVLRFLIYKFLRGLVLSRVKGIVGVTYEIINHTSNKKFNKPSICIPNGIDLNLYHTIKTSDVKTRIGLFFIGSPGAPWHGIDVLEDMANHLPEFDFHVVGITGQDSNNLFWHGFLQKNEYLDILLNCHICLSTLGLYRTEMEEACPLKAREYLAYGYPMILGYIDTAFVDKKMPEWALQIDPRRPLDLDLLKNFILKYAGVVITHSEVAYIDNEILENTRLDFFKKLNQ